MYPPTPSWGHQAVAGSFTSLSLGPDGHSRGGPWGTPQTSDGSPPPLDTGILLIALFFKQLLGFGSLGLAVALAELVLHACCGQLSTWALPGVSGTRLGRFLGSLGLKLGVLCSS